MLVAHAVGTEREHLGLPERLRDHDALPGLLTPRVEGGEHRVLAIGSGKPIRQRVEWSGNHEQRGVGLDRGVLVKQSLQARLGDLAIALCAYELACGFVTRD